ncbi:MAG: hypothetical protein ABSA16_13405 [Thermoguttaceae bacterium]
MNVGVALCFQVNNVGFQMVGKRRFLMINHPVFSGGENLTLHLFRPAFKVRQDRPGGGFIAAAGCHFPYYARAVPILGGIGSGNNDQPVGAVFPDSKRCRSAFFLRIDPLGKPFAFADDDLCVQR